MSDLIAKRLARLPTGTGISITWPGGVSGYETAAGTVTENNQKDGIALETADGEEVLVAYTAVYGLRIPKSAASLSVPVQAAPVQPVPVQPVPVPAVPVQPVPVPAAPVQSVPVQSVPVQPVPVPAVPVQAAPVSPAVSTPQPVPAAPAEKDDASQNTEEASFMNLSLSTDMTPPSDRELKELFSRLPKRDRKRLNGSYDSFRYGVKCHDNEKMLSAASSAARILLDGYEKGHRWDSSASRFCGALCRRAGNARSDLYLAGRWYWEAAWCACQANQFTEAGACAVLGMLEPQRRHEEDLLEILKYASAVTYDLSGILLLWDRIPERMEPAMPALMDALFSARAQRYDAGGSIPDALSQLKKMYPKNDMLRAAAALNDGENSGIAPLPVPILPYAEPDGGDAGSVRQVGWIRRYDTAFQTGELVGGGETWTFRLRDVTGMDLRGRLAEWTDAEGAAVWAEFSGQGGKASDLIAVNSPLVLARELADNALYREAMDQCKEAVGSPDGGEALGDLVRYALDWDRVEAQPGALAAAAEFCEAHQKEYPGDAWHIAMLGQLYFAMGDLASAVEYMRRSLAFPHLSVKLRVTFLAHFMRYCVRWYQVNPDPELMRDVRERAEEWLRLFQNSTLADDMHCRRYHPRILRWKCRAECELDMPEEAEQDYLTLLRAFPHDPSLPELREHIRAAGERSGAVKQPDGAEEQSGGAGEPADDEADEYAQEQTVLWPGTEPSGDTPAAASASAAEEETAGTDTAAEAEEPEPVPEESASEWAPEEAGPEEGDAPESGLPAGEPEAGAPYADLSGWDALHMTKEEAASIALSIRRGDQIPAALACLRAGAALNPELLPLSRAVSLAANDPMSAPDYSPVSLMNTAAEADGAYPRLHDCALAAAFLRTSFQTGREFDYSARAMRDSLAALREFPPLAAVYQTLDAFRAGTGCGIDAYAGYRSADVGRLRAEQEETVRLAGELYEKYIASPPRESARFKRLLETKKLLFSQNGELAGLLRMVKEREEDALLREKEAFSRTYLNGSSEFSPRQISTARIDAMIGECWDQALKTLQMRKSAAILQGNRRNNIRSAVSEILSAVCRWYDTEERSGGAGRTAEGEALYAELSPDLSAQLSALSEACTASAQECAEAEDRLGPLLLDDTARELAARLDGSWRPGQEWERYVPFLMSDWILLDEHFLPDLSATFCALPHFHIFARIQGFLAEPELDAPARMAQIYGPDRFHNNYGTAALLMRHLRNIGQENAVSLPENAERFAEQSALQAEMRLQEFLENCALAENCGRISRTDSFCGTLKTAARGWYQESVRTGNYGFFFSLLRHAEAKILVSARQYGTRLAAQLHAMEEGSPGLFDGHPEYRTAVERAAEEQNYIVAEDRMHRIRTGDFEPDSPRPEPLAVLADFWARYDDLYRRAADTGRSLARVPGGREEDASGAQRLAELWSGAGAAQENLEGLLSLLGWRNARAECVSESAEGRTAVWRVHAEAEPPDGQPCPAAELFGAGEVYVVCLSGVLDCTRLCEKIRAAGAPEGDLLVLLDCALSAADRHALARAMKERENGLRGSAIVIDRVLAAYLADAYEEGGMRRILLSAALPFSGCLPPAGEPGAGTPLRAREARELLAEPLAYLGISLPKGAVVSQILSAVNYLPGLIRLYARKLAEALREPDYAGYDVKSTPPYAVSEAHLRRVLSDRTFREQVREGVLGSLAADSRYYPLALLMGWMDSVEPSDAGFSAADVLRHAEDMGIALLRGLDVSEMEGLLRNLQALNILRGVREDTWLLMSRPFRDTLGSDEELLEKLSRYGEAES